MAVGEVDGDESVVKNATNELDNSRDNLARGDPLNGNSGFNANYEAKEIIGRGLASTVRRCVEKGTGHEFAVKIVDISTERQTELEARRLTKETHSEVQLLRQLAGHPSIIAIHDFYEMPTFLFAVFELAPHGELFDLLNKAVSFSEKKTRQIMWQLFEGVDYMHSRNIVHRDLKLENILCIDDKRIVISDFGFAKQLAPNQKLRELFGTPGYLAPETLRCQMYENADGYGVEVDNWALGIIMYTLLAGYAPFYHRQQLRLMRMIQEGKYEFKEIFDTISEDAKDLIRSLLIVDVKKRICAAECLTHKWMLVGVASIASMIVAPSKTLAATPPAFSVTVRSPEQIRRAWRVAQDAARFMCRLRNFKYIKQCVDRSELRKRPYRSREIRHEAEAAAFAVYGHWVNRDFYYSRDMLFANKPRPKYIKTNAHPIVDKSE